MSTPILIIQPVAVGTNPKITNIPFSATDWIEIKNDSPFSVNANVVGVSSNSFNLTPFEHNGWPISQLIQASQLKINALSIQIVPSHYYTDVATENNSPTNICTVSILSASEASTNTYPLYTARMNTTVATVANTVNNTGNPAFTPFIFAEPIGDASALGAVNINNSGFMQLGDATYSGQITVSGTDGRSTTITNDNIQTPDLSVGTGGIISTGGLTVSGGGTALDGGLWSTDGSGVQTCKKVNFTVGSISDMKYTHIASVTTTAAFVNHNLGVIPDFCILIPNDGVLSSANFSAYYESSSMTSTQVKLQSNSVGGIPVGLVAIKA